MSLSLEILDQTSSGRTTGSARIDGIDPRCTLRDLIRTRVRDEVARFNADRPATFHGLVTPESGTQDGDGIRVPDGHRVDWERQAEIAEAAFKSNGFFVIVDDRQETDLDAELALGADSEIRFVRLTQLVGG